MYIHTYNTYVCMFNRKSVWTRLFESSIFMFILVFAQMQKKQENFICIFFQHFREIFLLFFNDVALLCEFYILKWGIISAAFTLYKK